MLTMSAEALSEVTTRIFRAAGAPDDVASLVAYSLVDANLAGHDSHGVIRIPTYIEQIAEGDLVPSARPRIEGDRAGLITVDGAWAFGQYAAHVCMDLASSRAK